MSRRPSAKSEEVLAGQHALPGLQPNIATAALESLCRRWLREVDPLPKGELSSAEADRLTLACLLLAQEDAQLMQRSVNAVVGECLAVAQTSNWNDLDEIPWRLVLGYVEAGRPDERQRLRVQNLLGHHDSSIREWFHFVAWMILPSIEADAVRNTLLSNIADKLGGVVESAGLLAILHPDKTGLDAAADAFEPPEGFEKQYRERLGNIFRGHWNSFTNNLWQAENGCRKLIWDAVKGQES